MRYKRGKLPARPLSPKAIRFGDVLDSTKLPLPPSVFGHQDLMGKEPWRMLGNDEFGNCVWTAKAHMQYLWSLMGGRKRTRITTFDTLSDYHDQAGFKIGDPSTDQGTDMASAAEYHRLIGIRDATNSRRKVHSYINLDPGNVHQVELAAYLFGAVEIGVMLGEEAGERFDRGQPWVASGSTDDGSGHCVCIVGRDQAGYFLAVTWGRLQRISADFLRKRMDQGIAYLNEGIFNEAGLSPEAFDKGKLEQMLSRVPRRAAEAHAATALPMSPEQADSAGYPTQKQFDIAFKILRADIDRAGYGWMISDEKLRPFSDEIAVGVVGAV